MGKDSIMRNLAMLNQLWDGNSLTIDRRTSESFTVKGIRLTVALQIQEATLQSFFDRSGGLARGCYNSTSHPLHTIAFHSAFILHL